MYLLFSEFVIEMIGFRRCLRARVRRVIAHRRQRLRRRTDVDTGIHCPDVLTVGVRVATDLLLTVNRPAVRIAADMKVFSRDDVLQANAVFSLPVIIARRTNHLPSITFVAGAVFSVGGHLLIVRQRRGEVVAVQILSRGYMKDSYHAITFDWCPSFTFCA